MSPLELFRTRIQASFKSSSLNITKGIKALVRDNGIHSLWRGLSSTLWRDVPFSAIYWFSYEKMCIQVKQNNLIQSDILNSFVSGCFCGSVCSYYFMLDCSCYHSSF